MGTEDRQDEMSEEEKEMRREFEEAIRSGDAQLHHMQDGEEWQELMPNQSPSLPVRVLKYVVLVMLVLLTISPAIMYMVVGFESAVVAFMVAFLFFFVQSY